MTNHNLTFADNVYAGKARSPKYNRNGVAPRGLPVSLPIYHDFGAVATADADGICASQAITAAGTGNINGALASGGVATFDVPRNVVAGWTNTAVMTVTGTDEYGNTVVESSASGTSFTGKKAFKTITAVNVSANVTGATVGSGVVFGLPFRIADNNQVEVRFDGAADAATVVAADDTAATATTGDVRGTVDPSGTPNGTATMAAVIWNVNRGTDALAFGVDQFAG